MKVKKKEIPGKFQKMDISNGKGSNGSTTGQLEHLTLTTPTFTKRDDTTLFGGLNKSVVKSVKKLRVVTSWEEVLALEPGTTVEYLPATLE